MQPLSDNAINLVLRLRDRGSKLAQLFSRPDSTVAIVEQLQACDELGVVCHLVPYMLQQCEVGVAVRRAIAVLVDNITTSQLWQLDDDLRFNGPWSYQGSQSVRPDAVTNLSVDVCVAAAVFGVLSCHPIGYVRERAVRRLSEIRDGREVRYLLLRMNDWVAQVREASQGAVLARIDAREFAGLFDNLDAVFRIAECRRTEHSVVVDRIVEELASVERISVFANALGSISRCARRRMYKAAIVKSDQPEVMIRIGLNSGDAVIRLWAARDAANLLSDSALAEILPRLLADSFMPVRRQAIVCQLSRFPDQAEKSLQVALLDKNAGLRNFAQYYERKRQTIDLPEYYRRALANGEHLCQAISGLGETGCVADVELLLPFLKAKSPSIRAAAVRSLGTLADKQRVSVFVEALRDDHKKVCDEAVAALARRSEFIDLRELWRLSRQENRRHVLVAVNRLLGMTEFWSSLPIVIELAGSADEVVSTPARIGIRSSQNRVFTSPSPSQLGEIETALNSCRARLPANFFADFKIWLDLRKPPGESLRDGSCERYN